MVPLATPARLATSSSRVAAKPRPMNSSMAAAMIASRRSAARAARPDDGSAAGAAPWPRGFLGDFLADFGGVIAAAFWRLLRDAPNMTDQSVIVKKLKDP